jgi:hypothetical protein
MLRIGSKEFYPFISLDIYKFSFSYTVTEERGLAAIVKRCADLNWLSPKNNLCFSY